MAWFVLFWRSLLDYIMAMNIRKLNIASIFEIANE